MSPRFATIKRRATANPDGPEALRLSWLQARAIGSPRGRLLELIVLSRDRGFAIPEIEAFVAEELARAREELTRARAEGTIAARTIRVHERTIELAQASERKPHVRSLNPMLVRALEVAGKLAEKSERSQGPPGPAGA
jgi:DNA-binding transcriptional MerR regulator